MPHEFAHEIIVKNLPCIALLLEIMTGQEKNLFRYEVLISGVIIPAKFGWWQTKQLQCKQALYLPKLENLFVLCLILLTLLFWQFELCLIILNAVLYFCIFITLF